MERGYCPYCMNLVAPGEACLNCGEIINRGELLLSISSTDISGTFRNEGEMELAYGLGLIRINGMIKNVGNAYTYNEYDYFSGIINDGNWSGNAIQYLSRHE